MCALLLTLYFEEWIFLSNESDMNRKDKVRKKEERKTIIKIPNINSNWKETVSEKWRNKDIFQKTKFKTILRSKTSFW